MANGPSSHWLVVDPQDANRLYMAQGTNSDSDATLLQSDDVGVSWSSLPNNLPATRIRHLAIAPEGTPASRTMYAAVQSKGTYKSSDSGTSWSKVLSGSGDARMTAIDPTDSETVYAVYRGVPGGIHKSTDAGGSWQQLAADNMKDPLWLLVDPEAPETLYVGQRGYSYAGLGGVWKSIDGGESFERVLNLAEQRRDDQVKGYCSMLAFDPNDSARIYAVCRDDGASYDTWVGQGLWVSDDRGLSWQAVNDELSHKNFTTVVVDPLDRNNVYVGSDGRGPFLFDAQL